MKAAIKRPGSLFLSGLLIGCLLLAPMMNTCTYAEETELFHDVVEVVAGIQYLAALKSDGTVSLAKINYSLEPGSEEEFYVDFTNSDFHIPVDMDVLQAEVSNWTNICQIGILPFSNSGGWDDCELLVGLDHNGKLHIAGGFAPEISDYCHETVYSYLQVGDWSDVVSFSTCRRLLLGVRADGHLLLAGLSQDYEGIEFLAENASDVASVKMAWSGQGPGVVCLFRDGRLGTASYDYDNDHFFINCLAEDVEDYDLGQSEFAVLHTDGTVSCLSSSEYKIQNRTALKQICCVDYNIYVLRENGTVSWIEPFYSDELADEVEFHDTDWGDIKRLYTNHCGNSIYGILGLTNNGTVVTEWNDYVRRIDLSGWTDISDIAFPQEHIVYVAGLRQDGNIVLSPNVTAEMYLN